MQRLAQRTIPLVDLRAQYATIADEVEEAMRRVIASSAFVHGPFAETFEREFAAYCGARYCVGVGNGTDALLLALRALGIGPGDEVITTPLTFTATAEAIVLNGAAVRFVDVDPLTRNMDPTQLEAAITPRTKALLPVHLYGLPADMRAINQVARGYGLAVVEDAAQAHGAEFEGRRAGSLADVACFSFYPGKNLGAYGDAGAVVTDDPALAERVRRFADHGRTTRYEHDLVGVNSRLDGLQAAVLSVKLRHLEAWSRRRRELAAWYDAALADLPQVGRPSVPAGVTAVYHLYVIEAERRDELLNYLHAHGVAAGIHYPLPLHLQPAYAFLGIPRGTYPVAERLAERVLSLPIFPEMSEDDVAYVAALVRAFYRAR